VPRLKNGHKRFRSNRRHMRRSLTMARYTRWSRRQTHRPLRHQFPHAEPGRLGCAPRRGVYSVILQTLLAAVLRSGTVRHLIDFRS